MQYSSIEIEIMIFNEKESKLEHPCFSMNFAMKSNVKGSSDLEGKEFTCRPD